MGPPGLPAPMIGTGGEGGGASIDVQEFPERTRLRPGEQGGKRIIVRYRLASLRADERDRDDEPAVCAMDGSARRHTIDGRVVGSPDASSPHPADRRRKLSHSESEKRDQGQGGRTGRASGCIERTPSTPRTPLLRRSQAGPSFCVWPRPAPWRMQYPAKTPMQKSCKSLNRKDLESGQGRG